jgi:hypothetical protein
LKFPSEVDQETERQWGGLLRQEPALLTGLGGSIINSMDSSAGIAIGCGGRGIGVRFLAEAREIFLLSMLERISSTIQ